MALSFTHFAILALGVCFASAQIAFPGKCPEQAVVNPFDAAAYLGKWYEIEAYFQVFNYGGRCTVAQYSLRNDSLVQVFNSNINTETGDLVTITGTARLVNGTEGKLGVSFPVAPAEAPYWVLDTDYENYSIVWACNDFGAVHFVTSWYLSRTRTPSNETRADVRAIFEERGIDVSYLRATDQTDCPPDATPPPVIY